MRKRKNYLDYIPMHNPFYEYTSNTKSHIEIRIHHTGIVCHLAQKLFKRPEYTDIELDDFGTFVWNCVDGKRSVYEIGSDVKEHFGTKAEPLYERLCSFFKKLHEYNFIVMRT